jgi:hypothetical protein
MALTQPYAAARSTAERAVRTVESAHRLVSDPAEFPRTATPDPAAATMSEQAVQASLLRCVFGNPFRPVAFDPSWRTEAVVGLARGMDEAHDFAALPVLADALEDTGCTDAELLAHCRGPGPHARGCHAVDHVLGRW